MSCGGKTVDTYGIMANVFKPLRPRVLHRNPELPPSVRQGGDPTAELVPDQVSIRQLVCSNNARIFRPQKKNWRRNPNKLAEQTGGLIFQKNSFPVTSILVPGPKCTFLLVAV